MTDDEVLSVIQEWKAKRVPSQGPQEMLLAWQILGLAEEKGLGKPMAVADVNDLMLRAETTIVPALRRLAKRRAITLVDQRTVG
jgi:hypothetical protein